jgi:hypothetical protein
VKSLLSGSPGPTNYANDTCVVLPLSTWPSFVSDADRAEYNFYGYDLGHTDEDLGKNDDANAISTVPPASPVPLQDGATDLREDSVPAEFGFGMLSNPTVTGGYYNKPVLIRIPKTLEPLPPKYATSPQCSCGQGSNNDLGCEKVQ